MRLHREDIVLAATDELAIVMHGIACYPSGFVFQLDTTARYGSDSDDDDDFDEPFDITALRQPEPGRPVP